MFQRSAFAVCLLAATGWAQQSPIYYDYLENGTLRGGRVMLDRSSPDYRRQRHY